MKLRSTLGEELGVLVGTALGLRLGDRLESKPRLKLSDDMSLPLNGISGEGSAKSETGGDANKLLTQMAYCSRAEQVTT